MRELVTRRTTPPPPPDYPTTIEVLDYCQRWIAEHAPELIPRSTSMRTQATGWLYFTSPKALVCKLSHGRVDLYVGQLGFNGTVDDLVALTGSPAAAPAGFAAAVDTKGNPVLRRETGHRVTPADGLPNDTADIDVALQACADAARWLGTGPALLETSAE